MHLTGTETIQQIASEDDVERTIVRLAYELVEKHRGVENLALVGIRRRGEYLARRLAAKIEGIEKRPVLLGFLDITFYRDDIREKKIQPELNATEIPFDVTGKTIVLVDDVLYTGRTVRAAMDELMDLGRPAAIQLCVLIDRGHRELPVFANFTGQTITTFSHQQINVMLKELDGENAVYLITRKEE